MKIADFGLARLYFPDEESRLYSPQVSTRWYRAPEILWGSQKYGPPVDMWASGCVVAEMLRGVPLFAVYIHIYFQIYPNDIQLLIVYFRVRLILNNWL